LHITKVSPGLKAIFSYRASSDPSLEPDLVSGGRLSAEVKPPAEGGVLPAIVLHVPDTPELQQYLGLGGKKNFTIPEIEAEVVLIEIFSMY
jgi:hypothetical protein